MDASAAPLRVTEQALASLAKPKEELMCARSRMAVKRKGAAAPALVACTLLPYDPAFELGETLAAARRPVELTHRHCATFCVFGGADCAG